MTTTDPLPAPVENARRQRACDAAADLLRTALLAKLAVDLEDPTLARRAARHVTNASRLLAGLDFPAHTDDQADHGDELPDVEDLLERMPSRRQLEDDQNGPDA